MTPEDPLCHDETYLSTNGVGLFSQQILVPFFCTYPFSQFLSLLHSVVLQQPQALC